MREETPFLPSSLGGSFSDVEKNKSVPFCCPMGDLTPVPSPIKPSTALETHRETIRRVVRAHRASNPRVFGSVLHGDDTDGSDLDLLVDPSADASLLDIARIQVELEHYLGVSVDVLTPRAIPEKFRDQVLREARLV